ncbi:MAG: carboxypeptidase-like regulatory domain-containing protein [Acidobacteriota bacterium]
MKSYFTSAKLIRTISLSVVALTAVFVTVPEYFANTAAGETRAGLGTIKGIVRDEGGSPIADATVAIFKAGTTKLLKQVRSASDGSFLTRIIPGTYKILAVAEGFNPVTLSEVQIDGAEQFNYGFKLARSGSGNTLPEKRLDRNNPKWSIRAAQTSRSIYQNSEGDSPIADIPETDVTDVAADRDRKGQTVAETYFASNFRGAFSGINAATLIPLTETSDLLVAGQLGIGKASPKRLELQAKFLPVTGHKIRLNTSIGSLGSLTFDDSERSLGQISFQALDEWSVREGVVVVLGFDYSKFIGAGHDQALSPRFGLQFDIDPKTRFTTAYTTQTESRTWSKAIELEDAQVIFRDPVAIEDIVVEAGRPVMNKSRRFEFGIERVLDNNSNIAANIFLDTTMGRGIGLANLPFDLASSSIVEFVGSQNGRATGLSLVYTRRINGRFSTAAGYSFGSGQKLSAEGITNPAELFQTDFFQSFYGQFEADLSSGTNVKTIFRLSPQATVFAIDPFQGRLAIYDPSLSIMITQSLPNLGLPFHAQAVVDARNLFDFQTGVTGDDGMLRVSSQRRGLRGSILVRF